MARAKGTLRVCEQGHRYRKSSDCPVCPICASEAKQKMAGKDLPPKIGAPALRALDREGIKSLAQLAKRSEAEILELHGMGPKAIGLLKDAMQAAGLSFR